MSVPHVRTSVRIAPAHLEAGRARSVRSTLSNEHGSGILAGARVSASRLDDMLVGHMRRGVVGHGEDLELECDPTARLAGAAEDPEVCPINQTLWPANL